MVEAVKRELPRVLVLRAALNHNARNSDGLAASTTLDGSTSLAPASGAFNNAADEDRFAALAMASLVAVDKLVAQLARYSLVVRRRVLVKEATQGHPRLASRYQDREYVPLFSMHRLAQRVLWDAVSTRSSTSGAMTLDLVASLLSQAANAPTSDVVVNNVPCNALCLHATAFVQHRATVSVLSQALAPPPSPRNTDSAVRALAKSVPALMVACRNCASHLTRADWANGLPIPLFQWAHEAAKRLGSHTGGRARSEVGASRRKVRATHRKALILHTALALGDAYGRHRHYDKAEPLLRDALHELSAMFGTLRNEATLAARSTLGSILVLRGRHAEAEKLLVEGVAMCRAACQDSERWEKTRRDRIVASQVQLGKALIQLAELRRSQARIGAATMLLMEARSCFGRVERFHREQLQLGWHLEWARCQRDGLHPAAALRAASKAVDACQHHHSGVPHITTCEALIVLADVHMAAGHLYEAEEVLDEAVAIEEEVCSGKDALLLAKIQHTRAALLVNRKQYRVAEEACRSALSSCAEVFGSSEDTLLSARVRGCLAAVLLGQAKLSEGAVELRRQLKELRRMHAGHPDHGGVSLEVSRAAKQLRLVCLALGQRGEAAALLPEANAWGRDSDIRAASMLPLVVPRVVPSAASVAMTEN